jgi:hypothetical protein
LDDVIALEAPLVLGWVFGLVVGTMLHELGHALAARAVGLRPRLISLGQGRPFMRVRVSGAWLVLRALPVGGYTHTELGPRTRLAQRLATTAGGPIANLLLLLVVAPILPSLSALGRGDGAFVTGFAVSQAMMLLIAAVPSRRKLKTHASVSDGMRFYLMARRAPGMTFDEIYASFVKRHLQPGEESPTPSARAAEIIFQRTRRDRKTDGWAMDEVEASITDVLADPDLPAPERSLAVELLDTNRLYQRVRDCRAELGRLRHRPVS